MALTYAIRDALNSKKQYNFLPVQPLIAGEEGLAAFLKLAKEELKEVVFQHPKRNPGFLLKFKAGHLRAEEFPLDLWKKLVPYVPELRLEGYNKAIHAPMIEALKEAKNLVKVFNYYDFGFGSFALWKSLVPPSVKTIQTCPGRMFYINHIIENKNLENVEIFFEYGPALIKDGAITTDFWDVVRNFNVKNCKFLKLEWVGKFISLVEFSAVKDPKVCKSVESLELQLNYLTTSAITCNDELTELLELFAQMCPNLKKAALTFYVKRNDDAIGGEFAPVKLVVDRLCELVGDAEVGYDLALNVICDNKVENAAGGDEAGDAKADEVTKEDLKSLDFKKDEETHAWLCEKTIDTKKILIITYKN